VVVLRPENGLAPKWYDRVGGLHLARNVQAGDPVRADDFDATRLPADCDFGTPTAP
jgi:sialic acid synthase SpsE